MFTVLSREVKDYLGSCRDSDKSTRKTFTCALLSAEHLHTNATIFQQCENVIMLCFVVVKVLGKACKVIPVMLMGKVVSGNVYEVYEWITAGMLSFGISLFLLSQGQAHDTTSHTDNTYSPLVMLLSGLLLMLGYMTFDSFTSNWQVGWITCFPYLILPCNLVGIVY